MFQRQRQTDEVYSTLQQVQRKMSNYTADGTSQSGPSRGGISSYEPHQSSTLLDQIQQYRQDTEIGTDAHPRGMRRMGEGDNAQERGGTEAFFHSSGPAAVATPGMRLTVPLIGLLVVLYLLSVAVAYYLGMQAYPGMNSAGVGLAQGEAGHKSDTTIENYEKEQSRTVAEVESGSVFILKSANNYSRTDEKMWQDEADKLNGIAQKRPDILKPYFGLRKSKSGGLQLIYGKTDDGIGVERSVHGAAADQLKQHYKDAYWLAL